MAKNILQDGTCDDKETCRFLNVVLSFLFQELKDSLVMKRSVLTFPVQQQYLIVLIRFIMRRVQKEFEDFMTKTQGKLVEQLTVRNYHNIMILIACINIIQVRDYSVGKQLPVFHSVQVTDIKYHENVIEVSE